jgi:hypothetical protein
MYKVLVFLKKIDDEKIISHFKDYSVKYFSDLIGKDLPVGSVESNPLLDVKYSLFTELEVESKEYWEKLFSSEAGENLEKDLLEFHKYINIIFINYEHLLN